MGVSAKPNCSNQGQLSVGARVRGYSIQRNLERLPNEIYWTAGIPHDSINDWTIRQHQLNWNHPPGQGHSKRIME